jgi:hypothetical protein
MKRQLGIVIFIIAITGTARAIWTRSVTLFPGNLSFGNQKINTTSPAKTAILNNRQNVALRINSITAPTGYSQTNTCGAMLAAHAACSISVRFRPTGARPYNGMLTLVYNAP